MTPGHVPSLERVVQDAAERDLVEPQLDRLPAAVADALRVMVAGERPAATLSARELTTLGQVVAGWWESPYGRSCLGFGSAMNAMMAGAMAQAMTGQTGEEGGVAPDSHCDETQEVGQKQTLAGKLVERVGLPPDKAARVDAVVRWPIGFVRRDLADWARLSDEETEAVWDFILGEYGLYTTGTRYAAP